MGRSSSSTTSGITATGRSEAPSSSGAFPRWAATRRWRRSHRSSSHSFPASSRRIRPRRGAASSALLRLCIPQGLSADDLGRMLDDSLAVPAYVRQGLFGRVLDNDDVLKAMRVPVLLTHGTADAAVKPSIVEDHERLLVQAQVDLHRGSGHAMFWSDAPEFNRRLRSFCAAL